MALVVSCYLKATPLQGTANGLAGDLLLRQPLYEVPTATADILFQPGIGYFIQSQRTSTENQGFCHGHLKPLRPQWA